jgi:hypothetical protein
MQSIAKEAANQFPIPDNYLSANSRPTLPGFPAIGTRPPQPVHLPSVKIGCQRLSGQNRTEMMYCPQLCSAAALLGVAGTWGVAVLRTTPIRM